MVAPGAGRLQQLVSRGPEIVRRPLRQPAIQAAPREHIVERAPSPAPRKERLMASRTPPARLPVTGDEDAANRRGDDNAEAPRGRLRGTGEGDPGEIEGKNTEPAIASQTAVARPRRGIRDILCSASVRQSILPG